MRKNNLIQENNVIENPASNSLLIVDENNQIIYINIPKIHYILKINIENENDFQEVNGKIGNKFFGDENFNVFQSVIKKDYTVSIESNKIEKENYEVVIKSVKNEEGKVAFASLSLEIKERIKLKKKEDSFLFLKSTLEHTNDGILVIDLDGEIIFYNQKLLEIWEINNEDENPRRKEILKLITEKVMNPEVFIEKIVKLEKDKTGKIIGEIELKNGHVLEYNAVPNKVKNRIIGRIWNFRNSTEKRNVQKKIERLTQFDPLTGVGNRLFFFEILMHTLELNRRYGGIFAILFLDLDRFKDLNDTLGYSVGDLLLKEVAQKIKASIRRSDIVARMGSDEFTVILTKLNKAEEAGVVAQKVIDNLQEQIRVMGHEYFIGVSIGIAIYPSDGIDADVLVKNADTAMDHVKKNGRNSYQFFTPRMNLSVIKKLKLEADLRDSIGKDHFELYYQPQIELKTGKIVGLEALIRWNHPEEGLVSPIHFIPIAEETNLIIPLGKWIFEEACRHLKELQAEGYDYKMAINISGKQVKENYFLEYLKNTIKEMEIDAKSIELELTENIAMENLDEASLMLQNLSDIGFKIVIDDFGTGYSSLSYLKRFPVEKLKIDRAFIKNVVQDEDDATIVKAVIAMSHSLNIEVIAEGVEYGDQYEYLKKLGCDEIQGYLFGRPMPIFKLKEVIRDYDYINMLTRFADEEDIDI